MTYNGCTAMIRYVAEDSRPPRPRNLPRLGFLSLPREIRDIIYDLALVSTSSIIVWKGKWETEFLARLEEGPRPYPLSQIRWRAIDHDASTASLRSLNLNLLFCNKVIGNEAAMTFYHGNTFAFLGEHNWDPVVDWLGAIGLRNRESIVSLDIDAQRPDAAWQNSKGERVRHPARFTQEEVYPRHPLLHTCKGHFKWGSVDNINPALEKIFILLGQRVSEQKVILSMQFFYIYPGAGLIPGPEDRDPDGRWYSMELPNLVELFRHLHTQQHGSNGAVEVLWKGKDYRTALVVERADMESLGWHITVSPVEKDRVTFNPRYDKFPWRLASFVLRREKLTEPLLAQDPSPHSEVYTYEGMDADLYL
ncbi:hypothetical protein LOCC1_G008936 [Lachnellula occidentalis]|uniref:F-box domain-containing protein n=1 Tax=Lachnellula occidentalis TaxID=215460 RepID=A0A8H8RUN4_9HELO|nr:hypothetical protein LOCC1_G008936 [Lachnellula occidentalis]